MVTPRDGLQVLEEHRPPLLQFESQPLVAKFVVMLQVTVSWYVSPCNRNDGMMMTVVVLMKINGDNKDEEGGRCTGTKTT
jgi:hypothetical protein